MITKILSSKANDVYGKKEQVGLCDRLRVE